MATEGIAEQPFFIYDHTVLQQEEDDIKDAIIYYYPPMTSTDDRCALCGQLMGIVRLFVALAGAPPSVYQLQRSKVAVRHEGRFTLALGGDKGLPNRVLLGQLGFVYQLFQFYHRDMDYLAHLCEKQGRDFVEYLGIIWDTYIPFTRYYGDDFLSAMQPVPTLQLTVGQSSLMLRATHLLEACQRPVGVLAGALLVHNRVLCTQLTPTFTSRLLLLRPQQSHDSLKILEIEDMRQELRVDHDYSLPQCVRLLAVYVTKEEEGDLHQACRMVEREHQQRETQVPQPPPADCTQPSVLGQGLRTSQDKGKKEGKDKFVSSISFLPPGDKSDCNPDPSPSGFGQAVNVQALDKSLTTEEVDLVRKPLVESDGREVVGNKTLAEANNEVVFKTEQGAVGNKTLAEANNELVFKIEQETLGNKTIAETSNEVFESEQNETGLKIKDHRVHTNSVKHTPKINKIPDFPNSPIDQGSTCNSAVLELEGAMFKEQSCNVDFQAIPEKDSNLAVTENYQMQMRDGLVDILANSPKVSGKNPLLAFEMSVPTSSTLTDEDPATGLRDALQHVTAFNKDTIALIPLQPATTTELFKAVKQVSKMAAQNYESMTSEENSSEESPYLNNSHGNSRSGLKAGCDSGPEDGSLTSPMKQRLPSLTRSPVSSNLVDAQRVSNIDSVPSSRQAMRSECPGDPGTSRNSLVPSSHAAPAKQEAMQRKMSASRKRVPRTGSELHEVDMFVMENSDVLLLLLMERGTSRNKDTVNKLWQWALPQLEEVDLYVKERHIKGSMTKKKDLDYNYLLYDSSQRTLTGNMTQPVTVAEHKFCDTAVHMHEEFCSSDTLTDIILRSHNTYVYAHGGACRETYFQLPDAARPAPDFPNERRASMAADAVAFQKMLVGEQTLIL